MNPRPFGSRRIARDSSPARRCHRSYLAGSPTRESRFTSRRFFDSLGHYRRRRVPAVAFPPTPPARTLVHASSYQAQGRGLAGQLALHVSPHLTSPRPALRRLALPRLASPRVSSSRGVRNLLSRCRRRRYRVVVVAPCRSSRYASTHGPAAGHNVSGTLAAPRCDNVLRIQIRDAQEVTGIEIGEDDS